ncbi:MULTISPECIES: hypothetical protein [Streptomyces]|uniref:Integral membrane protein n=2 Tax=Streptomyces TaxID=1883 RepID=A0ABU4KEC8_9ACTN|nr:hypothetical protein [Streptomyces roseolus]MDX2295690.1 hypothetical protein [Streptomyces roseolus]
MSAHSLDPLTLLTALAATGAVAWCAAGRRRGPVACAGATLAAQGVLHLAFSLTGAHTPAATPPHTGHLAHMPQPAGAAPAPDALTDGGAGMLAAHLLAALLCGLWLARGEAAFFALAEAALTPLRHLLAVPLGPAGAPADPRRPVRRPRRDARRPHVVVLAHVLSRRGPPRPSVPRATVLGPLV